MSLGTVLTRGLISTWSVFRRRSEKSELDPLSLRKWIILNVVRRL